MKLLNLAIIILLSVFLFGCGTKTIQNIKSVQPKPETIIVNLTSDPGLLREEWRFEFEQRGYKVYFSDEINTSSITNKEGELYVRQDNVVLDDNVFHEIRLAYQYRWDIIWYISKIAVSIRELQTGRVLGSFQDEYFWRHPNVSQVMEDLDENFFNIIWE